MLLSTDADMTDSCCSSDDESFCDMVDACSFAEADESLCYDTDDNNETMPLSGDEDECDINVHAGTAEAAAHFLCNPGRLDDVMDHSNLTLSEPFNPSNRQLVGDADCLSHLMQTMRSTGVSKCSIQANFFRSLSMQQRRALVDAMADLPSLTHLELDSVFAEYMYTLDFLRSWKRDHHYRYYKKYCAFENNSVEHIRISEIPSSISEQVLGHLVMLTVASFASLQTLSIGFVGGNPDAVLMRVASAALNHSNTLEDVSFCRQDGSVILDVGASRNYGILKLLKLNTCTVEQHQHHHHQCLSSPSYTALAQMLDSYCQTLRAFVMDTVMDTEGAIAIAKALSRNNKLKALCLGTFDCQDNDRREGLFSLLDQILGPGAGPASSLEYMSLVCQELDDAGVELMSKMLAGSNLRELMLFLDNHDNVAIGCQGLTALAQILQVNETLESFSVICNTLNDDGIAAVASVLQHSNRTLKNIKIQCNRSFEVTFKGYHAFVDMLKVNTVIESIALGRCQQDQEDSEQEMVEAYNSKGVVACQAEMEFYLKLNRGGVRDLQLNNETSLRHFFSKVLSNHQDLETLFYMLSENPSFVVAGVAKA